MDHATTEVFISGVKSSLHRTQTYCQLPQTMKEKKKIIRIT